MKKSHSKFLALIVSGLFMFSFNSHAQNDEDYLPYSGSDINIEAGIDIYSSYIWRGLKFGSGAAFQPYIELHSGNFTLGAWNNISTGTDEAFEINLYASYEFPFGVTIGLTDYFEDANVFGKNFDNLKATHSLEPFSSYDYGDITFFGGLMFYQNEEGENKQDFYGEISFSFDQIDLAIGAGDGRYVTSPKWGTVGEFAVCNISVSHERTIKITESFSVPLKAAATLNPYNERFFVYVGLSL